MDPLIAGIVPLSVGPSLATGPFYLVHLGPVDKRRPYINLLGPAS